MIWCGLPEDASDEEIIAAYEEMGLGRDYALTVIEIIRGDVSDRFD